MWILQVSRSNFLHGERVQFHSDQLLDLECKFYRSGGKIVRWSGKISRGHQGEQVKFSGEEVTFSDEEVTFSGEQVILISRWATDLKSEEIRVLLSHSTYKWETSSTFHGNKCQLQITVVLFNQGIMWNILMCYTLNMHVNTMDLYSLT